MICSFLKKLFGKKQKWVFTPFHMPVLETEILEAINKIRIDRGILPLKTDATLYDFAKSRALELKLDFSHYPAFNAYRKRAKQLGLKQFAENLARNTNDAEAIVNSWRNSQKHRNIMLSSRYNITGMSVHRSGKTCYIAQFFGKV